jgi:hypothetical protein
VGVRTRNLDMIAGMRQAAERDKIEHAQRVVERWNEAIAAGRDIWWSPTIRAAIIAGMPFAEIYCPGCRMRSVRLNALKHGLLSRDVVLSGEDAEAFEDLRNRVWADLAPIGPLEELLTDRVINAVWRLRRLERVECALFHWRVHRREAERLAATVNRYVKFTGGLALPNYCGEETITDEASHTLALKELRRAEFERDRAELSLVTYSKGKSPT